MEANSRTTQKKALTPLDKLAERGIIPNIKRRASKPREHVSRMRELMTSHLRDCFRDGWNQDVARKPLMLVGEIPDTRKVSEWMEVIEELSDKTFLDLYNRIVVRCYR